MPLRASDAEATALGAAAAGAAAYQAHRKICHTCNRAKLAGRPELSCDEGYEMLRTVHKANALIKQIREDKKARKALQRGLF